LILSVTLTSLSHVQRAFVNRVFSVDNLVEAAKILYRQYGRTMSEVVLYGIGGLAPRSTIPNLAELLATLVTKLPDELRVWMHEILYSVRYLCDQMSFIETR
jgi:hypothetical protein